MDSVDGSVGIGQSFIHVRVPTFQHVEQCRANPRCEALQVERVQHGPKMLVRTELKLIFATQPHLTRDELKLAWGYLVKPPRSAATRNDPLTIRRSDNQTNQSAYTPLVLCYDEASTYRVLKRSVHLSF